MAEEHGGGEDGGERVRHVLAGDVGGGAVDGLVEAERAGAEGGGGEHADGAGQHGRGVGEDVAEDVAGDDDVELSGGADQLHAGGVDIKVGQLHVGVFAADLDDDFAPELHGFEHVGLVDGAELVAAEAGGLEAGVGDAGDLVLGVAHGVDADASAVLDVDAAGLAEIEVPVQFAEDEHVDAFDDLGAQGGGADELGEDEGGAEVGEEGEFLAELQQAGAGAEAAVVDLVRGAADRAEQDGVGVSGEGKGRLREGGSGRVDAGLADGSLGHLHVEPVAGDGAEHLDGLRGHFGADAVAGQDCDLHVVSLF